MQITRETDYAIRCVLHLSESPDKVASAEEIATAREIPKSFVSKILQKLAKNDIVRSLRGTKGGFTLMRRPLDISLLDVIEAIQGPVGINKCAIDKTACGFSVTCNVHPIWVDLRKTVEAYLRKTTFAQFKTRSLTVKK
jgi:Rrf2 family protein